MVVISSSDPARNKLIISPVFAIETLYAGMEKVLVAIFGVALVRDATELCMLNYCHASSNLHTDLRKCTSR